VAVDAQWLRETRHKNQLAVGLASNNGYRHPVNMGLGGMGVYTSDISAASQARHIAVTRKATEAREIRLAEARAKERASQIVLPLPKPTSLPRYLMYGAVAVALVGVVGTIINRRRSR
jgi:hypothetical protein